MKKVSAEEFHGALKEIRASYLTEDERYWLCGLLGGWLCVQHHPAAARLAEGILAKLDGEGKRVLIVEIKTEAT